MKGFVDFVTKFMTKISFNKVLILLYNLNNFLISVLFINSYHLMNGFLDTKTGSLISI
jgi:hypothetical protein